jgi:hypothetical protein
MPKAAAPAAPVAVPVTDAPLEQLEVMFGVAATTIPAGNVSVTPPADAATNAVALLIVRVNVDTPPCTTLTGAKALENAGTSAAVMLIDATAAALSRRDDVKAPDVLVNDPLAATVTSTL